MPIKADKIVKYVGSLDSMPSRIAKARVVELITDKEPFYLALVRLEKEVANLRRDKESFDLATKKLENEVTELKRKENLAKKLVVDEFKASKEYKEVVEEEVASYFGEGFDLCKKHVSLCFPDLDNEDIQINPDCADGDGDAEVDEDGTAMQDATLPINQLS
ncbi:hypothetical protein Acr_16g0001300 [Actinidia rufa]|uniref:Uncharacterized protein n=1 Tax=Actinidia rufa TaxID=165716 RepID=A0A7J0FXW4_9ERIC|nr:hypothetical protein Acr_16g0001300 [Actinidia rufa]